MNKLREYFLSNDGNKMSKWSHYFDVYDFFLKSRKDTVVNLLEIGVNNGGSLFMWRDYFDNQSSIYGIDINPNCKILEKEGFNIFIGSQSDAIFLNRFINNSPKFDIIIDDGGHTMEQQLMSFDLLFPHLKDDGLYVIEDTHTSYWKEFGGGLNSRNSFIQFSKNLVDQIHWFHIPKKKKLNFKYSRSILSIHFYDSMIVIQKGNKQVPVSLTSGEKVIDSHAIEKKGHGLISLLKKLSNKN